MNILNRFSRITRPGKTFIPQVDGLRFLAIVAVLACHVKMWALIYDHTVPPAETGGFVGIIFDAGHLGVALFFAISGFILSLPFAQSARGEGNPISLRDYFMRRITRIEPPYILHLCFLVLVAALVLQPLPSWKTTHHESWIGSILAHLFASLFYANGFIFQEHPRPNIVLWSLEVEVQFYLLAPVLAKIFRLASAPARILILTAAIILDSIVYQRFGERYYLVGYSLLGNLHFFLIGLLLTEFYLTRPINHGPGKLGWDILFVLGVGGMVFVHLHPFLTIFLPWMILGVCLAGFYGKICSLLLGNRWITTIGGMCYTIYLYHWLMLAVLGRATGLFRTHILWLDFILQFVVLAPIIIMVSAVLFILFERPFMDRNWPSKLRALFFKVMVPAPD